MVSPAVQRQFDASMGVRFHSDIVSPSYLSPVEKRILSGLMAYVDIIACLSYFVLSCVPTGFVADTATGSPVWFIRTLEWCTTCPHHPVWHLL